MKDGKKQYPSIPKSNRGPHTAFELVEGPEGSSASFPTLMDVSRSRYCKGGEESMARH